MSDTLDIATPDPGAVATPTAWLVVQAIKLVNSPGDRAEAAYRHVVELLAQREDVTRALADLLRTAPYEDVPLRWSTLYVAGDVGDASTAELLYQQAVEALPERNDDDACEGPADGELLIRSMAVEGLQRVAKRHRDASQLVLRLIEERPAQPVLIEAVKAARALDLTEKARDLLGKGDRWVLELSTEHADKVVAEPERDDDDDPGQAAPELGRVTLAPRADCRTPQTGG